MRRFVRGTLRLLQLLGVVLLIGASVGLWWLDASLPELNGSYAVTGITEPARIVRDRKGIPHIYAQTYEDAMYALGFAHAQDRLYQMESQRRIGAGRLSEVAGSSTVAFDRMGISCEPVASAAEALARLVDEHFDLALVDVVMPDMDGYKLTREIKRSKRLRQIPVIILTSRSSPFDLARAALAGCDTYLTKPVPFRALEAAVLKQLRKALAIDDLAGLVRISAPPQETAPARPVASRVARLFGR